MQLRDLLNPILFLMGSLLVAGTLLSAIRTVVLPRNAPAFLTRLVFLAIRTLFEFRIKWVRDYKTRDSIMALYAPIALLALPACWLTIVLFGYMLIFWTLGFQPWYQAFLVSGSSLLTLGFAPVSDWPSTILAFSEATIGLGLVALLIAYLPTMYTAFSRRETTVALLEVYTGSPPSPLEMLERFHRIQGLGQLRRVWADWEVWFAEIEESHTSLNALVFFRSAVPERSWVTAAGCILDAAAFTASTVDLPRDPQAELCIRAGYLALRRISDYFGLSYNMHPHPTDPISITRQEYDAAYDHLEAHGIPLKPDREQSWRDFAGWRVNYDAVLVGLMALTMAPKAAWITDRIATARPLRL